MRPPGCWLAHIGSKVDLCGGDAFNEQHDAGAGRASVFDWQQWLSNGRGAEQRAAAIECSTAVPVGEQSEVTDADESSRQDMEQESPQELMRRYGHDLLLVAMCVVSPAEGDLIVLEGHETMAGDRHAMGISSQVAENMFRSSEGWLGIDHPIAGEQSPQESSKVLRSSDLLK